MAAIPGIKYDEELPGFSANCFPVRTLLRQNVESEVDGAWLVAHRAEQRKRFKAILCTKPKTYARIKEERRRAEKQGTTIGEQHIEDEEDDAEKDAPILDGFFLMRHCCVEDPSDLCSVNLTGKEIQDVKEEDLALFDNVAYVNASENFLPFEAFRGFPILRELEMPLNGLRSIKPNIGDYPTLEVLDVSYNNLSHEDILTLGLLKNLKVLHLTGNGLTTLPASLAMPYTEEKSNNEILRFSKLEILLLDDNRLEDVSVFAALAGLSSLKHLNLEKNELYYVPMLKSVEGKVIPNEDEKEVRKLRRSARGTRSKDVTPRKQTVTKSEVKKSEQEDLALISERTEAGQSVAAPTPVPAVDEQDAAVEGQKTSENSKPEQKQEQGGENGKDKELVTEDLEELSRNLTDLDLAKEISLDTDRSGEESSPGPQHGDGSGLPPFPDLRILDLANNKIEEEEALLAVAAWPMLVEIIINNNPLTTENSGDPPLLSRFLGDRLGIKIKRKKEGDVVKPPVEVKIKKSRQVSTVVPKIPKLSVDTLLMLEGPRPPPVPKPERIVTQASLDQQRTPLPPIPATPPAESRSRSRPADKKPADDGVDMGTKKPQPVDGDAFFMTQVDGQEEETHEAEVKKEKRKTKKEVKKDNRYKGYEILLDVEDNTECPEPKDMQGNIKALKYALNHELVYRDPAVRLDQVTKPVEPYRKSEVLKSSPRITQGQKKEQMLTEMRSLVTTEEAGLDEVIARGNKPIRKKFPDSDRLLSEIQRRYNAVRVNSMKEAKEARKLLSGNVSAASKTKDGSRSVKLEV